MKTLAAWGLVGCVALAGVISVPVEAETGSSIKGLTKAAGKLVGKITGTEVSVTTVSATVPDASAEKSARINILDKQTNRRQTVVLIAGTDQTVGTVQVKLTKCMPDYGAVLGQDVAWLDITDGQGGSGRTTPWFSGWMFNMYPEVSTLDHPRYDVQLQGCGTKVRQVMKASGSAPVLDSAPAEDTETPNDVPAAAEENTSGDSDPYTVPGVKDHSVPAKAEPSAPAAVEEPVTQAEPQEEPVVVDEVPAAAAPTQQVTPAASGGEQGDLHKMMDSGQY